MPALMCSYLAFGADNIAFGIDYPMENNNIAVEFKKSVPVCDNDKQKIGHLNAETLLKL